MYVCNVFDGPNGKILVEFQLCEIDNRQTVQYVSSNLLHSFWVYGGTLRSDQQLFIYSFHFYFVILQSAVEELEPVQPFVS